MIFNDLKTEVAHGPCGRWLASDDVGTAHGQTVDRQAAIANSLAPTLVVKG
jgi:hypothetical protein